MRNVIQQSVLLPATAEELFRIYLDPEAHAAITGAPVEIGKEPGAGFKAFEGMLTGQILAVVEPRFIVQSWRSGMFHEGDPDSTLMLVFKDEEGQGRIDLVHLDVPDHDYDDVVAGWEKYYWKPWRTYLECGNTG